VQHRISEQQAQAARVSGTIADAVQRLAQLYVPGFTEAAIKTVPEEFRRNVSTLYEQKRSRIEQLDELLDVSARHVTDLQRREIEAASVLTQTTDRRVKLEDQYRDTLAQNEAYQAARSQRATLRLADEMEKKELERRKTRKEEFQSEYHADPFFSYFLKRDVEGSLKNPTIVQRLDRRFARKVYGFSDRKCRYDMFDAEVWESQERLRTITTALSSADAPVKDIEARIADELGLSALKDQVVALTNNHKSAAESLTHATQDQTRYRDERRALDEEHGSHYQKAVSDVVSALTGRSIDDLVALARTTPSPEDDGIVGALQQRRAELNAYNAVLSDLRGGEREISSTISALQSQRDTYKRQYDAEQAEIERRRREEQRRRDEERREEERRAARRREESYRSSHSSHSSGSSFGGGFSSGGGSSVGGSF